jgi:hypothetical protein
MNSFTRLYIADTAWDARTEARLFGPRDTEILNVVDISDRVVAKMTIHGRPTQRALGEQVLFGTRAWAVTMSRPSFVYAARLDGEEYHFIAESKENLELVDGAEISLGQCENCGSFTPDGEPCGARIKGRSVCCDGCGRVVPILLKSEREVVFA